MLFAASGPFTRVMASDADVILTLELPAQENGTPRVKQLTLDELRDLPGAGFRTHTIWTEGLQSFEGVWVTTLLRHFGVTDGTLKLTAINDYTVTSDVAVFAEGEALLAYERNGAPMSPRGKGPLWLVYNYDADPAFRTESVYALSIWQLDRIAVSR